jgi:hypothetical protein
VPALYCGGFMSTETILDFAGRTPCPSLFVSPPWFLVEEVWEG